MQSPPAPDDVLTRFLSTRAESPGPGVTGAFVRTYDELHQIAARAFLGERGGHMLQSTAVVHELWLKPTGRVDHLRDPALAARAMCPVVADEARSNRRLERGGGGPRITFSEEMFESPPGAMDLADLDDYLQRLEAEHERAARIVELRAFGGLSIETVAQLMDISVPTVKRDWQLAKLWLAREFNRGNA